MLYESDQDNEYLEHYGVPGQKWGVITKEYQKVGYDHRYDHTQFKNRQSEAVAKRKRKQMAREYEMRRNREKAYRLGQSVGDNFFYKARYNQRKKEQEEYRQAHPKKDIVEKSVEKVADHFGLKEYSKVASDFIKDQAKDIAMGQVMKLANKGLTEVKGTKFLGKILSKPIGRLSDKLAKGAAIAEQAIAPKNVIKNGAKFIGKTAKVVTWDAPKTIGKGFKWLKNVGYPKARTHAHRLRNGAHFIMNNARKATSFLASITSKASTVGNSAVAKGRTFVQAGSKMMIRLLSKMRR